MTVMNVQKMEMHRVHGILMTSTLKLYNDQVPTVPMKHNFEQIYTNVFESDKNNNYCIKYRSM